MTNSQLFDKFDNLDNLDIHPINLDNKYIHITPIHTYKKIRDFILLIMLHDTLLIHHTYT